MPTRLQKFIAHAGRASRRKTEELIRGGRVRVNGHVAQLGSSVDEKHDMVEVDGIQLRPPAQHKYIMLHKPTGYVSTKARFPHQKSVYELVPDSDSLALAGRLDKDSSGLLLLTNDGDLIFQITHPSFHHSKIYDALLAKSLTQIQLDRLSKGVQLEEGIAKFDAMRQISEARYRVTLHQGWKRQVRRMFAEIGIEVRVLQRIQLGRLSLGNLPKGKYKEIAKSDIV